MCTNTDINIYYIHCIRNLFKKNSSLFLPEAVLFYRRYLIQSLGTRTEAVFLAAFGIFINIYLDIRYCPYNEHAGYKTIVRIHHCHLTQQYAVSLCVRYLHDTLLFSTSTVFWLKGSAAQPLPECCSAY